MTVFGAILLRSLLHQHVHFLRVHFDAIGLTDFGQQKAKTHAADGDVAILFALGFHFLFRSFRVVFTSRFLLKLRPNLFKLGLNHRRRNVEIMIGGELVKQLTLHIGAGQAIMFLLDLNLHQLAQLVDTFKAEHLGKIIIGFRFDGLADFIHNDVERRGFALQRVDIVIFRESHVDQLLVIGLHANQLVFKTGDELARAKLDRHAFALATIKRHAVDLAFEIDNDAVAHFCGIFLVRGFKAFLARSQFQDRFVDLRIADVNGQTLQRDTVNSRRRDGGQDFKVEINDRVLAWRIVVIQMHMRLRCRAKLVIGNRLLHAVLNRAVQRVLKQRILVHFLDQIGRNLAGAETGHPHLRGNFLHLGIDARFNILRGNRHPICALQAFILCLDGLHNIFSLWQAGRSASP